MVLLLILLNTTNTNTITRYTSLGWCGWGAGEIGVTAWVDYIGPADWW